MEKFQCKLIPEKMFLTDDAMQTGDIGTGDEVFITGLFAHMSASARNLPIVRMGNIAMMPDEEVPTKRGPMEAYLIEARSIGGLSGSPAFVRETSPLGGIGKFHLLGLMHGHWDIPPEDKNTLRIAYDASEDSRVNLGIATVVPARKVREVLNQPGIVEIRQRVEK
jgi:hypothetical protein